MGFDGSYRLHGSVLAGGAHFHSSAHFFDLPYISGLHVKIKPRYFISCDCIDIMFTYLCLSSQISDLTWVVIVVHRSVAY